MTRILILGGSGILGSELCRQLELKGFDYAAPRSYDLDIRDSESLVDYVNGQRPNWIVNCAAWTNVEAAEEDFSAACELNEEAISNLVAAAKEINSNILHISTDYVFDGQASEPYSEESPVNPINSYGKSKLQGEKYLLENYGSHSFIVRTSWLYGVDGKSFVKSMVSSALRNLSVQVVVDQIGSPTSSKDLAGGLISLIQNPPKQGIYHYSNQGQCSWFEFAREIYESLGKDPNLVQPINTDRLNLKAKRPLFSLLNKAKWEANNLPKIPQWKDSYMKLLPEILDNLKLVEAP